MPSQKKQTKLSDQKRYEIIFHHKGGTSSRKIAAIVKCNQSSVIRVIRKYAEVGKIDDKPRIIFLNFVRTFTMTITTEEFVAGFYSISGTTIGERRKSLFLFLNGIERSNSNCFNFSQLLPKTPLEEKFKVEVLIYFRRIPDLIEILKSENLILIERILKVEWFLKEAFQNISGEALVTLIFPHISFNAKQKLLNKLSTHLKSTQADDYFKAIEKKYGLYLASKLLSVCSIDLIINCINTKRIKITPRQLLTIIKRNPAVTELILKAIRDKNVSLGKEYKNIFLHIAQHDLQLFWKLYIEHNLSHSLGWRITYKFIQLHRKDVIDNPRRYYKFLHNKQIAKSLNQDFGKLYRNLFPESLELLSREDRVFFMIEKLPSRMRNNNLLFTTFEKVYGSHVWDHESYRDMKIFKMLPPNERETRSALEYKPYGTSEEEWYCYMKTETSIPYLLQKMSLTSDIRTRVELVRLLVKTCYINEDKTALLNMCKYMLRKHRNDNVSVRRAFLTTLKAKFQLEHLDEEHWTVINELIQLFILNEESFDDASFFFEDYIHFYLIRGLPVEELLVEWLKKHYRRLNIIQKQPLYERQCLLAFGEIISELLRKKEEKNTVEESDGKEDNTTKKTDPMEEEEEETQKPTDLDIQENILNDLLKNFVDALILWNRRYPKDPISIFSYSFAVRFVQQIIAKGTFRYDVPSIIKHCLPLKTNLEWRSNLINAYIKASAFYKDGEIIEWLARNEPLAIIKDIDAVALCVLQIRYYRRDSCFIWKWWRNYKHLENFQNAINVCLLEFEKNRGAFAGLSYLMGGEQFKTFIKPYYPSSLRPDANTKETKALYTIQKYVASLLSNIQPSSLALESLLIFCKGDYLKLVQRSLYSVCSNVNEDKLVPFFAELAGRAVSARKHAMHLTFRVLDKEQVLNLLNRFMETEKNASIRKFILRTIFNFFVLNPSHNSWEMVQLNVNTIDINDKEALEILMQWKKIPLQYLVPYVVFTWDVLNKQSNSESEKESNRICLLDLMTANVINLFPKEFCNNIIEKYFFKSDDASFFSMCVNEFTCRYIIYCDCPTEQEKRLKSCFEVVRNFVSTKWQQSDIRRDVPIYVGGFLKQVCTQYLTKQYDNTTILIHFGNFWTSLFKIHEGVDEYLHLQFTLIYVKKLTLPQIGQELAQLCNKLAAVYGFAIINIISKKIHFFGQYFLTGDKSTSEENWYIMFENLILPEKSVYCQVLIILLLNDRHHPTILKTGPKYEAIIEMLLANGDPIVELYLESHFRNY